MVFLDFQKQHLDPVVAEQAIGTSFQQVNALLYPTGVVAVEVKRSLAKELAGQNFTVQCQEGDYVYAVLRGDGDDWHEFNVDTLTPIT